MQSAIARWTRPHFQPAAARSCFSWVIWLPQPDLQLQLSRQRHGLPPGDLPEFTVQNVEDRDWLAGFHDLVGAPPELANYSAGVVVRGDFADAQDMFALQAGIALVKAFCDLGAPVVLDMIGMRWWTGAQLSSLPPQRSFGLSEHVELVWENDGEHLMHTRGMAKFARPELFTREVLADEMEAVAKALGQMAMEMALGRNLSGPDLVAFPDDSGLEQPPHGLGPEMFRNAALEWLRQGQA